MTAKKALVTLAAAFKQENLKQETIEIYEKMIADIPAWLLEKSVIDVMTKSKFFPSIAEIRETAARLCGLLPVSPAEAVAIVKQADVAEPKYDRAGRYCYTERYWDWPKGISQYTYAAIHEALQSVGDPFTQDGKAKFGWEQSFAKAYETKAEESSRYILANLKTLALPTRAQKAVTDGR